MMPAAFVPLVGHLWQSTIFAATGGLLALVLRRNRASVRYWLWLAASYKFLVPFSLLVRLGSQLHKRAVATMVAPVVVRFTDVLSGPLLLTSPASSASALPSAPLVPLMVGVVWACGFSVVVASSLRQWMRIRAVVRSAKPIALDLPILAFSTPARIEPGIFGLFRPVLLIPAGIEERLTPTELQAVFVHELCHVRRRDNLTAAVHMLVEAIFWFYPLVWWVGVRLIDERERACDEEVLKDGAEVQMYAEGILKVCKLCLESSLTCVSGVTGSNLKKRIGRIMGRSFGIALSSPRKWLLAVSGIVAFALPFLIGALTVPWLLLAQSSTPAWQTAAGGTVSFEVASVKPTATPGRPSSNIVLVGDAYAPTGGLFAANNTVLLNYLRFAFKDMKLAYRQAPDLAGAPGWIRTQQYDIEAKAQGNPTKDQMRLMMQSLLADRFKLAVHYEIRRLPVYALVLAKEGKPGPQLKQSGGECSTTVSDVQTINRSLQLPPTAAGSGSTSRSLQIPCGLLMPVAPSVAGRMRIAGRNVPLALLADMAGAPVAGIDRPIVERTGLGGTYDISVEFAPIMPTGPVPPGFTPDETGPTFVEALRDQLGLKLDPQNGPVNVVVIDHVEEPSAN
jgi:uncharacterized protein (TIGR03435 family)